MRQITAIIILIVFLLVNLTIAYASFPGIDDKPNNEELVNNKPIQQEYHDEDEPSKEIVFNNIRLSVRTFKDILPAGGGQTNQIIASVTHDNNLPAEGVHVGFFANEREGGDRSNQLSVTHAVTDANGVATSTYTTLAEDDNKHIMLMANTKSDNDWINKYTYLIASNEASLCKGRIINPFTGESLPNTSIDIMNMDTGYYFMFENETDENGCYSITVPPGLYHIRFYLDLGTATYYSGNYTGSHCNLQNDNTMSLRIEIKIDKNKNYSLNSEMGIMKGILNNKSSGNKLYIVREGNRGTVIADINPDGSFMIPLSEGIYEINARGGHILKQGIKVRKGKVTDLGSLSR